MRQHLLISTLAALLNCGAQTLPHKPPTADTRKQSMALKTDNIETVVRRLLSSEAAPKSEFETTAQFEARKRSETNVVNVEKQYSFVYESDSDVRCECEYNADQGYMSVWLDLDSPKPPIRFALKLKSVEQKRSHYVAQNAFGVKITNFSGGDFIDGHGSGAQAHFT